MRKVKFQDVLRGAADSTVRIYDTISNDEFTLLRGFISRRLREAWESEYWPELMLVESRTWDTSGDIKYVSFTQSGETEIGQVYRVLDKDPRADFNWSEYPFYLHALGIVVHDGPDTPYVEFRKRAPELPGRDWSGAATYAVGDQVYYSGDFWNALTVRDDSTAAPTSSDTTNWEKQSIPYIFKPYLEKAAASDMLLLDEKPQLAGAQTSMAKEALDIEAIKLYR